MMEKEKQFRLVLKKPGKSDEVLAIGNEEFCESRRLKYSMEKYNASWLRVEELGSTPSPAVEKKTRRFGIGKLILLFIAFKIYEKIRN